MLTQNKEKCFDINYIVVFKEDKVKFAIIF